MRNIILVSMVFAMLYVGGCAGFLYIRVGNQASKEVNLLIVDHNSETKAQAITPFGGGEIE